MKRLLLLLLLALPGPWAAAQAQTPIPLTSLTISLWPEFDQPDLLVIIDGEMATAGQQVQVPTPPGALINAVAELDAANDLLNAPYDLRADAAGNQIITLTPTGSHFRVEYYTALPSSGAARTLDFVLPAGYFTAVSGAIEVLLPPGAANIRSEPALAPAGAAQSGVSILQRTFTTLEGTASLAQSLRYDNASGALTAPPTPAAAAAPPAATAAPAPGRDNTLLIGGLAFAALLLALAGGYGLWRLRHPPAPALTTSQRRRQPPPPAPSGESGQDHFCRQCGAPFGEGDRFCRKCGGARG